MYTVTDANSSFQSWFHGIKCVGEYFYKSNKSFENLLFRSNRILEFRFRQNLFFRILFRVCDEIIFVWPPLDHYQGSYESKRLKE